MTKDKRMVTSWIGGLRQPSDVELMSKEVLEPRVIHDPNEDSLTCLAEDCDYRTVAASQFIMLLYHPDKDLLVGVSIAMWSFVAPELVEKLGMEKPAETSFLEALELIEPTIHLQTRETTDEGSLQQGLIEARSLISEIKIPAAVFQETRL